MTDTGRFVLLLHETPAGYARPTHWDFMLEVDGALRTWALSAAPDAEGEIEAEIEAEALANHRIAYLELEGEISGGRGSVTRQDFGVYQILFESAAELRVYLRGQRLIGEALLRRDLLAPHTSGEAQRWKFKFTFDRSAMGSLSAGNDPAE